MTDNLTVQRTVVFISKATPGDDEFVLWLAPRLEAAGYEVFADIQTLQPGDRWRKEITNTLQDRAVKMLLCCRDSTLAKEGVQEEIGIAQDLTKSLGDKNFIIPIRLEPYRKLFGIGELQYIDFVRGWADGLGKLLDALKRQKVPCDAGKTIINSHWDAYRRRNAIPLKDEPERLTSNWLRVAEAPDSIYYFEPTGSVDRDAIKRACENSVYPMQPHSGGFLSFRNPDEIEKDFGYFGKFLLKNEVDLLSFVKEGSEDLGIRGQDASNMVHSMLRQSWNLFCQSKGLLEYAYSAHVGFHASDKQVKVGQKIPWGNQGDRRSSMLRNKAKGVIWQFGVTAIPAFWPFPHFKLKSRVLFSPTEEEGGGVRRQR